MFYLPKSFSLVVLHYLKKFYYFLKGVPQARPNLDFYFKINSAKFYGLIFQFVRNSSNTYAVGLLQNTVKLDYNTYEYNPAHTHPFSIKAF